MKTTRLIKFDEEDIDFVEGVAIDNRQAIEMADTYSNILFGVILQNTTIQFLKECIERSLWQNAVGRNIIKGQPVKIVQYKGGAIDIDSIETDEIMYTDRFKKPDWLN